MKMHVSGRRVATAVLIAAAVVAPSLAVAQGGLVGEARLHPGSKTWASQRTSRNLQHGREYARDFYRYSRNATQFAPSVARSEAAVLGQTIQRAQEATVATASEVGSDPTLKAAYDRLQGHLAAAAEHQAMLHKECGKDPVDGNACAACCSRVLLELDKAQAEHDAILRAQEGTEG